MIHTGAMLAQAEAAGDMTSTIIILVVIIVIILIAVLAARKQKALPGEGEGDEKEVKKLRRSTSTGKSEDGEKSLAEIKAEKRESTGDLTKEEKRALREERRAKNQTEKSKQEHLQGKSDEDAEDSDKGSKSEEKEEKSAAESKSETKETEIPEEDSVEDLMGEDDDDDNIGSMIDASFDASMEVSPEPMTPSMAIRLSELMADAAATSEDVFASLFGNSGKAAVNLSLDDDSSKTGMEPVSEPAVALASLSGEDFEAVKPEAIAEEKTEEEEPETNFEQIFLGRVGSTATSLAELERQAAEFEAQEAQKTRETAQTAFQSAANKAVRSAVRENALAEERAKRASSQMNAKAEKKAEVAEKNEKTEKSEKAEKTETAADTESDADDKAPAGESKSAKRRRRKKNKMNAEKSEENAETAAKDEKKSEEPKSEPKAAAPAKNVRQESKSLSEGLKETRSKGFIAQLGKIFRSGLHDNVVEELEDILYTADIGVKTSDMLLDKVTKGLANKGDTEGAIEVLRSEILAILERCEQPFEIGDEHPHVILTIGVNGAGKTTTLGKLAAQMTAKGKKVLLVAGDTFRAAAIEQLQEWSERAGCAIHCAKQGADPSATIYDGIKRAQKEGFDVVLADTAGRLHNKKDLVEELQKIYRVCGKALPGAPHQCILVLDSTNGQNALAQAREFGDAISFSGIILTKLDGTAKGGVIIGICDEFKKPIYFIGIGEMVNDLKRFSAKDFLEALFMDI